MLGVVILGLAVASVVLDSLIHQSGIGGPAVDALITAAAVVPVTAVGTFLAARQPRNLIGWMLLAIVIVELSPTSQYLILDYRMHHGSLPVGWAAVVLEECWPMFLVLTTLLLWLFPNGTLPPGRWHRAATIGAAGWLLFGLATSSRGVLVAAGGDIRIQANGDLANPLPGAMRILSIVVIAGTLISWAAWLVIQVPTYRHASGEHRQQLKWLYSGAAIFVAAVAIGVFIAPLAVGETPGWGNQSVVGVLTTVGSAALPVCMAVAVLKYRLYDIDRIISRVISYTLITAVLGRRVRRAHPAGYPGAAGQEARLPWPRPRWSSRPCSTRSASGCSMPSTAGSTAPGMTPRQSWPRSPRGCARPSIWIRSAAIWSVSSMRRSARSHVGVAPRHWVVRHRPSSCPDRRRPAWGHSRLLTVSRSRLLKRPYGRDLSDSQADSAGRFSSPTPQ